MALRGGLIGIGVLLLVLGEFVYYTPSPVHGYVLPGTTEYRYREFAVPAVALGLFFLVFGVLLRTKPKPVTDEAKP